MDKKKLNLPSQKLTAYTAIGLIVAILAVIVYVQVVQSAPGGGGAAELDLTGRPAYGDRDAPVQVAIFEDFRCPACARFSEDVFPQLENAYGDNEQVTFRFVNLPVLGPESVTAAHAAECVYQQDEDAFWEYKTIAYRVQLSEGQGAMSASRLRQVVSDYVPAVDADEMRACVDERRHQDVIDRDQEIVRAALGADRSNWSTPSVVVNGTRVSPSFSAIQSAIDNELALAEAQ